MTRTIPSLNGLRALSILMVLVVHDILGLGFGVDSWWLHTYAHAGVLVFFVVSGYLITTLMLREVEKTGAVNIKAFYIRRAWRLLPVAYTYLAIITLVQHRAFSWSNIALSWGYLASYGMSFDKNFPWDLGHLWSLSVEEQFYFVWPLIVASGILWTKRTAWAAVFIAPLFRYFCSFHSLGNAPQFSPFGVVDSIATGCLIAIYAKPLAALVSGHRWLGFVWGLAFAAPVFMPVADHTRFLWPLPQILGHLGWTLFNLSVGLGILWAIAWQPRVLNNQFANWLGTISYSLYVWHMAFMNPQAAIPFPFNLILSFLAAVTSYYLLEQPLLELRNQQVITPIRYTRITSCISI